MDKPKWIKFIVVSGIALSIIGSIISIIRPVIIGQVTFGYILFLTVITFFIILIFLKLYQLKNWARDIIILYSIIALIPVFNVNLGKLIFAYSLIIIPFYLFYIIYLMKKDVRIYFTNKKRSVLKIIGASIVVILAALFATSASFLGSIIDFEKGTFTERGKALFKPLLTQTLEEYKIKKQNAERLLNISFPEEYTVTIFRDYPDFTMAGFLIHKKKDMFSKDEIDTMFKGEEYVIIVDFKDKRRIELQDASTFLFENEQLKKQRWLRRLKLGDKGVLNLGSEKIPIVNITYMFSRGIMGTVKTAKHSMIFIAYTYGNDKNKELDLDLLKKVLSLF